ncbi:uncharacterized protein LOC119077660 [Bradysia coprophila]|uniref:uncharacterized protein LOC119077660 n=1 Tax=Bradysia coprophila TaxID=38358 RepID=UPI00187D71FF|nr:uncharacterized protein LOC119077660 [Bradysia coprophila]
MKNFKIPQTVVLIAILCHQSSSLPREKRSFWPFFGGGASTDVAETPATEVAEAADQYVELPTQLPETSIQQPSPGYSYPIFHVHKYNGFELRPLLPQQLQHLHTQVSYGQSQQNQPIQQLHQPNQVQNFELSGQRQPNNGQQFTANPNCQAKAAPAAIPPELQELAQQFGIKDASKLPSLDDAMGLLGTTTRAETIETIKELAATPDGMNLIRQFLASDEGAAASQDPDVDNQCNDASATQQISSPQPSNANLPHRQMFVPSTIQHQQYRLPYPPQHEIYGLPNAHRGNSFQTPQNHGIYQSPTHIMSMVKNEAVPHEQYGLPNELSTAHSEHQGYNAPRPNIEQSQHGHRIYGLPNIKPAAPFQQGYYAPRSNHVESVKSEGVPHDEYNVPNEVSSSGSETQELHKEYGVPSSGESHASEQHETYGLPNVQEPVNFHQQGPYPPKTDAEEPHQEYGVPNSGESQASQQQETYGLPNVQEPVNFHQPGPYPPKTDAVEPHQEYGVPNSGESHASEQHETYGLPNVQEPVNFHQPGPYPSKTDAEEPHQEYGVPNSGESHASQQQETYGLPNVQEPLNFHRQGPYPSKTDSVESAEKAEQTVVLHKEYNVPNEENHQTQIPHEVYGIPSDEQDKGTSEPQQTYGVPYNNENENVQQDQQAVHNEYAAPINAQVSNTIENSIPHMSYALPHQRFFEAPNAFRQPQPQYSTRYGAPTRYTTNNLRTHVPILRQIDGTLDRTHINLELGQLLTTTARPQAGFLERVGAWTRYFAPPGPTIPIVPPQVTEDVNESVGHTQNTYTIPIPKVPQTPQLPNAYIPKKFLQPPQSNQGPFIRVQHPSSSALTQLNTYEVPYQQPQPFDGQTVEEFVPDISQLPLEQRYSAHNLRTSYGIPTHSEDSSAAESETNEQRVAVILPNHSTIENEEFIDNDVVDEEPHYKYGPQRISSYDSYATGKLSRASDEAIIQLIPTQKPYTNQGRKLGQVEESSIIDAIATMTSGFRPIT